MTMTSTTLSDSISSLSSSASSNPPSISRTFKQAQQFFISRQLAEAWDVLTLLIIPSSQDRAIPGESNGFSTDDSTDVHSTHTSTLSSAATAPITTASRPARVKVWSLWIALLHALLELGPEEGAKVMQEITSEDGKTGTKRWRELSKRVKEGDVWEEVLKYGYGGVDGAVDAEVVCNLATLLLQHAPSQKLNQTKLETYIFSISFGPQAEQLSSRLQQEQTAQADSPLGTPHKMNGHKNAAHNGTSTPRDLGTRLKVLEIFALHVLPRNEEWDYARDFINMSEVLDEERKETFLAALGTLREAHDVERVREEELVRQRELEERSKREREQERQSHAQTRSDGGSSNDGVKERDFGVEASVMDGIAKTTASKGKAPASKDATAINGTGRPFPSTPSKHSRSPRTASSSTTPTHAKKSSSAATPPSSRRPTNKPDPATMPSTFLRRASLTIAALQRLMLQMGHNLSRNPMPVLRFLLFLIALVMGLARQDVRQRVSRAWDKVRETVGMGVKVRYL